MPCETCKSSYKVSYEVMVEKLQEAIPDLSHHELRVEAAKFFRPIHREMQLGTQRESAGNAEYDNGEFTLTGDGKMYFPKTEQFAEDFHLNEMRASRRQQNPDLYSSTDHQTTLLIQKAFTEGATVVRTSFAREGRDNRDLLEYRYDPETKKGVIHVVNTAVDGTFHTFESIKGFARQQSSHLTEIAVSDAVFVLSDVSFSQEKATHAVQTTVTIQRNQITSEQKGFEAIHQIDQLITDNSVISQKESSIIQSHPAATTREKDTAKASRPVSTFKAESTKQIKELVDNYAEAIDSVHPKRTFGEKNSLPSIKKSVLPPAEIQRVTNTDSVLYRPLKRIQKKDIHTPIPVEYTIPTIQEKKSVVEQVRVVLAHATKIPQAALGILTVWAEEKKGQIGNTKKERMGQLGRKQLSEKKSQKSQQQRESIKKIVPDVITNRSGKEAVRVVTDAVVLPKQESRKHKPQRLLQSVLDSQTQKLYQREIVIITHDVQLAAHRLLSVDYTKIVTDEMVQEHKTDTRGVTYLLSELTLSSESTPSVTEQSIFIPIEQLESLQETMVERSLALRTVVLVQAFPEFAQAGIFALSLLSRSPPDHVLEFEKRSIAEAISQTNSLLPEHTVNKRIQVPDELPKEHVSTTDIALTFFLAIDWQESVSEMPLFPIQRLLTKTFVQETPQFVERPIVRVNDTQSEGHQETKILMEVKHLKKVFSLFLIWCIVQSEKNNFQEYSQIISSQKKADDYTTQISHRNILSSKENESEPSLETPWILLSLIWHMTLLREGGMSQKVVKTKKTKKKKHILPVSGVIFRSF